MIYLTIILALISGYSLYISGRNLWRRYRYKNLSDSTPSILISTIQKHSRWSEDKLSAQNILDSYMKVKEYKELLEAFSKKLGIDNRTYLKKIKHILHHHEIIAYTYYGTTSDSKDRRAVSKGLEDINMQILKIEADTGTSLKSLKTQKKSEIIVAVDNHQSLIVHKENLRKSDIVRLYNHKATPLKDLSISLMEMLDSIGDKQDKETYRLEILQQLKDVSEALDSCIEALPTYDSNSFIDNKLKINRNLLEGLKNTEYVDTLQIETDKR